MCPLCCPVKFFRGKKANVQAPKGWPAFFIAKNSRSDLLNQKKSVQSAHEIKKGEYIS